MNKEEFEAYNKAKKKVKEIKSFYYHLAVYCLVMPIIIYTNLTFSPGFQWFWFSLLGWGAGVAIHGLVAFDFFPFLGKDWEERKLKEIMDKEQQNTGNTNNIKY